MESETRDEKRFYNLNFQRQNNTEDKIIYECHIALQSKA